MNFIQLTLGFFDCITTSSAADHFDVVVVVVVVVLVVVVVVVVDWAGLLLGKRLQESVIEAGDPNPNPNNNNNNTNWIPPTGEWRQRSANDHK